MAQTLSGLITGLLRADTSDSDTGVTSSAAAPSAVPCLAEEISAGLWQRAGNAAECSDVRIPALMVGVAARDLAAAGVTRWAFRDRRWWRCSSFSVLADDGAVECTAWTDGLMRNIDQRQVTFLAPRSAVVERRWDGVDGTGHPSRTAGVLALRRLEDAIRDELSAPRGGLLQYPAGREADGKTLKSLFQRMAGGWNTVQAGDEGFGDRNSRMSGGYRALRIGPEPSPVYPSLHQRLHAAAMASWGVPAGLWAETSTAPREAWRFFVSSAVRPIIGELVRAFGLAMQDVVAVAWPALEGHDLQPKARALASLVQAGVSVAEARSIVGL